MPFSAASVAQWLWRRLATAGLLLALGALFPASAQLGRPVVNIAEITYDQSGHQVELTAGPAIFTLEPRRTPSVIEFFRYAPMAPDISVSIPGADYSPSGNLPAPGLRPGDPDDPFTALGPPATLGGFTIDLSGPVPLARASAFLPGEVIFIRVSDAGQNADPAQVETVIIRLRTESGDEIVIRLYETGPDTGEFVGYVPSTRDPTPIFGPVLTTLPHERLTATYQDPFDASDVSVDTALVDPFGRLFDSVTGQLLSGVRVTIVEAVSGQPAEVFGIDGISAYPASLVTGTVVEDVSGMRYPLEPGQFVFPLMRPGDYRLLVEAPLGYVAPSIREAADFVPLPNAPFTIIGGSYGEGVTVTEAGPLNFDVPLDPSGDLLIEKTAVQVSVAAGDPAGYRLTVLNRSTRSLPLQIEDRLPPGFRLAQGSVRVAGRPAPVADVSADGETIVISAGVIAPGERAEITYVLTVSAGAPLGRAVNRARAIDGAGQAISNTAEASVEVIEDLLRSRFTLVGQVIEGGCDPEDAWPRRLAGGKGVAGVRVYLETGDYVVTDEDGLYHFEGVRPGSHVVQIDTLTLPARLEPVICEDNTRFAGSAISQFVDASGGSLWRANFHVRRTGEALPEEAGGEDENAFDDTTEYRDFDGEWLSSDDGSPRWVYPLSTRTPSSRSLNIGIVHGQGQSVELKLNGKPVNPLVFQGREAATDGPAEISRWRGVEILAGENRFTATIRDGTGAILAELNETIWHVTQIQRVRLVADQSELTADGRTAPVIALRLEDAAGRPVHRGRAVEIDVAQPYVVERVTAFEGGGIAGLGRNNPPAVIGADGIARIRLEPTSRSGRVRLTVKLDNGRREELDVRLSPERRDWILVGLAEGGMGLTKPEDVPGRAVGEMRDGRLALFAKGVVRGDWLLTLAVDTAKRRGARDDGLFEGHIDPNAYYTLYGDRTWQYSDAESSYPVYVKLEREAVQILFGDIDTDLTDTELGRYARRLPGFKLTYDGETISASGFAAETNQGFAKDEIAADGTSGPYRLSTAPVVYNSETVRIETRDRFRADDVLSVRTLTRWIDYELDYRTGELRLRQPVMPSDAGFNPNVIVIDYEAAADAERNTTTGGRVAAHTADRALEAGATFLREEGSPTSARASGEILAADVRARVSDELELRAEVARSRNETGEGRISGEAYLAEIVRETEALSVRGYLREESAGFGLGQQSAVTSGIRRMGADGVVRLGDAEPDGRAGRIEHFLDGRLYTEKSLGKGAERDVLEAAVRREGERSGLAVGLRSVGESYGGLADDRDSLLATAEVRRSLPEQGLTVTLTHEQPLGVRDETSRFPQRTLAGADKRLNDWAALNLRHEVTSGANTSGQSTLAGIMLTPWRGGEVRLAGDLLTQDSERRLGATLGVDQSVPLSRRWSASFGAAHRARLDDRDSPRDVIAAGPRSPFDDGVRTGLAGAEAFSSAYAGTGYRSGAAAASSRIEYRDAESGRRWTGAIAGAREANSVFSYGAAARVETETREGFGRFERSEIRVGTAYRPRGEGSILLTRFDARQEYEEGISDTGKLVGNFAWNRMLSDRSQVSVNGGLKYQSGNVLGVRMTGFNHLIGAELRHDITPQTDFGFAMAVLADHRTETAQFSFGPSFGFTPAESVWISVGYNIAGFRDRDFEAAQYSDRGPYIKFRVKFDQQTARGLLNRISPG